ncbi:hypothetical protein [uncultured Microbacterium sp.]|uniref:hypothetical protein n=1 Tax=uncultured Microbacterium sp. TaxID=191216 RepID=UPI0028DBC1A0|nr:hypothetical protein [uncultured Microbacterium sp.]
MSTTSGCPCDQYPGSDRTDPNDEERAGRVRIVSTSEPGWSMTYEVECVACARRFRVTQVDGPALHWRWVPRAEKRKRGARTTP